MSRLIRTLQRSSSPNFYTLQTLIHGPQQHHHLSLRSHTTTSTFFSQLRRTYITANSKSPFESNILRIISTEIEYQFDYAPIQENFAVVNGENGVIDSLKPTNRARKNKSETTSAPAAKTRIDFPYEDPPLICTRRKTMTIFGNKGGDQSGILEMTCFRRDLEVSFGFWLSNS